MAERVYRYVVPVDDKPHTIELRAARCAELGPLQLAASLTAVEFWAAHDDTEQPLPFTFQVFGTGQPIPPGAMWRGTAPRTREGLVWHLFELHTQVEPAMNLEHQATTALDAMQAGDHALTDRVLNQMVADHGPAGIPAALMQWCDAALARMPAQDGPVQLSWLDTATGRVQTTDEGVPATEKWACWLLAARASGDRDMFLALVQAIPDEAVPAHVGAMVQMAASIIQEATS